VRPQLRSLSLDLARHFVFGGDVAAYAAPAAEEALLGELARTLHVLSALAAAAGLPPLAVQLGGHTANQFPLQANLALSLQRARTVRADLLRLLDAAAAAEGGVARTTIVCRGYGGSRMLRRCVEVRLLSPAEAAAAADAEPAETDGAAAAVAAAAEADVYRRALASVQRDAAAALPYPTLLALHLERLELTLERPFRFQHDAARYAHDDAEADLLDALAHALREVRGRLDAAGHEALGLGVALEGHTADAEPASYHEALSLQRARRVRADLLRRLGADADADGAGGARITLVCVGHGGARRLARKIEVRFLTPAELRAALGAAGGAPPSAA
jgi:outer membrane protein OmpA-like peptidoglycan-associated protein